MVARLKPLKVTSHGRSDVGLVRDNNEDAWLVEPQHNVYVLCDGMGGHSAGEIASQEAVAIFSSLVKNTLVNQTKNDLSKKTSLMKELIQEVNVFIHRLGQRDRDLKGMGTTLCCVYFHQTSMIVGHVGDSRVYLLRNGELQQLTDDHSLVFELLELGELNPRQAKDYAYRHIITRAIGTESLVEATVQAWDIIPDDRILMCSDGLSDMLSTEEIEDILNKYPSEKQAVDRLIDTANRKGGCDNITAVLMKLHGTDD